MKRLGFFLLMALMMLAVPALAGGGGSFALDSPGVSALDAPTGGDTAAYECPCFQCETIEANYCNYAKAITDERSFLVGTIEDVSPLMDSATASLITAPKGSTGFGHLGRPNGDGAPFEMEVRG